MSKSRKKVSKSSTTASANKAFAIIVASILVLTLGLTFIVSAIGTISANKTEPDTSPVIEFEDEALESFIKKKYSIKTDKVTENQVKSITLTKILRSRR